MSRFTFIDLFAGIGGFRIGLSRNGGECRAFSEIDKTAIDTYCLNYQDSSSQNLGDITLVKELPPHDLLTAGVPCQSWSIAGKNLGFDDDRGQLWNDTIFLLNKSKPKAFIFENVKGLTDPRNKEALEHIMKRIADAGYFAKYFIINSYDYGVPQNRVRVYIIGFQEKKYMENFVLPEKVEHNLRLFDFLDLPKTFEAKSKFASFDLFGKSLPVGRTRFQKYDELNDFFLFNDIRNGHSTIHSWDIIKTSEKEKEICLLLLANRRKKIYGPFDGNPLSMKHFKELDSSIGHLDIENLISKGILKRVEYLFKIESFNNSQLSEPERLILDHSDGYILKWDKIKNSKKIKQARFNPKKLIEGLKSKEIIKCTEERFDFKYSKISSGIEGVNRIYLPVSHIYSTLVASDTNDYVATKNISAGTASEFKNKFLSEVYRSGAYRKITKEEACIIQGYPKDFNLPEKREKWMKLLGNSVSVPVIERLCKAMMLTGVFEGDDFIYSANPKKTQSIIF